MSELASNSDMAEGVGGEDGVLVDEAVGDGS
jgi:hypothetical protein